MRAAKLAVLVSLLLSTAAFADLALTFERDPADPFYYRGTVTNAGSTAASAPLVRFNVIPALRVSAEAEGWTCSPSSPDGTAECRGAILNPGEQKAFRFFVLATGGNGIGHGHFRVIAEASANEADAQPGNNRIELPLTIPLGYSIGSATELHDAIAGANLNCRGDLPCSIIFDIHTESGPRLMSLARPLPVVTACHLTIFSARRPPDLSDLKHTVSGELLTAGQPAFDLRPACENSRIEINGFALSGFTGDAISIGGNARATYAITRMELSTGGRGVYIDAPNADVTITDGRIRTGRSGVTAWAARSTNIETSEIGPTRASGIFIGPHGGSLTVRNSTIRDNQHFGIALTPGNATIALENARIADNTAMDIDWGLNGPDANQNVPRTPRIISATYDAARNVTRVVVDPQGAGATAPQGAVATVELWSSDGVTIFATAHLETFAGRATVADGASVAIEYAGDLRGQFVSAVRLENQRVSEPSAAVRVGPAS